MTTQLNKFLKSVMHSDYKQDEDGNHTKYSNNDFDIIVQKKRTKTHEYLIDSCIVIDKRNKPIVYNDISIAIQNICK